MNKALCKMLANALAAAMIFGFLPATLFSATAAPQSVPAGPPAPCLFLANVATNSSGDTYYTNVTSAGTTFQVAAWINTTDEDDVGWIGAFQYNSSQVFCTGVTWANATAGTSLWMSDNGWETPATGYPPFMDLVTPPPAPDNTVPNGSVGVSSNGFGEVLVGTAANVATSPFVEELVILTFQFQAGAIPTSGSISGYIAWDPAFGEIVTPIFPEQVSFGNYEYTVAVPPPDVAVTSVAALKTVVGQGFDVNVTVTATNPGGFAEAFNVTAYANNAIFASQNVTLSSGASENVTLTWNSTGFAYGNYTISAYAWPVSGETNITDNNCTGGWVIVSIVGDITGPTGWPDGKVDMRDVAAVARAFGSTPGSSNWNPNADINGDGVVNMKDIALVARNFGQHYP